MPETAEEISQQPEVRKELQRATGEKRGHKVQAGGRDKFWFVTHALFLVGCAVLYFLIGSKLIPLPQPTINIAGRILRGTALIVVVLGFARGVSVYGLGRVENASARFTLQRIMHLVVALLIAFIVVSVIFVNCSARFFKLAIPLRCWRPALVTFVCMRLSFCRRTRPFRCSRPASPTEARASGGSSGGSTASRQRSCRRN